MANSGSGTAGPVQKQIEEKLRERFTPVFMEIGNESRRHHRPPDAESHFKLQLVSESFENLKPIERQRQVNELLKEELKGVVHALTMKLYTPKEWDQLAPEQKLFRAIGHTKKGSLP